MKPFVKPTNGHRTPGVYDVLLQASSEHVRSTLRGRKGILHTKSRKSYQGVHVEISRVHESPVRSSPGCPRGTPWCPRKQPPSAKAGCPTSLNKQPSNQKEEKRHVLHDESRLPASFRSSVHFHAENCMASRLQKRSYLYSGDTQTPAGTGAEEEPAARTRPDHIVSSSFLFLRTSLWPPFSQPSAWPCTSGVRMLPLEARRPSPRPACTMAAAQYQHRAPREPLVRDIVDDLNPLRRQQKSAFGSVAILPPLTSLSGSSLISL